MPGSGSDTSRHIRRPASRPGAFFMPREKAVCVLTQFTVSALPPAPPGMPSGYALPLGDTEAPLDGARSGMCSSLRASLFCGTETLLTEGSVTAGSASQLYRSGSDAHRLPPWRGLRPGAREAGGLIVWSGYRVDPHFHRRRRQSTEESQCKTCFSSRALTFSGELSA